MRCSPQTQSLKFSQLCVPAAQELKVHARSGGPGDWVSTWRGEETGTGIRIEAERAECQTAGGPAGKREQGQLKPRNQLDRGGGYREVSGKRLRDGMRDRVKHREGWWE